VLRLYLDEDSMHSDVTLGLRRHGLDVLTTFEAGNAGRDDEAQLVYGAQERRAVVTSNRADFARLHARWMRDGRSHSGIVHAPQQHFGIGETIQRLLRLASSIEPDDMIDRVEYLTNWG
jgi:hypothetical protein